LFRRDRRLEPEATVASSGREPVGRPVLAEKTAAGRSAVAGPGPSCRRPLSDGPVRLGASPAFFPAPRAGQGPVRIAATVGPVDSSGPFTPVSRPTRETRRMELRRCRAAGKPGSGPPVRPHGQKCPPPPTGIARPTVGPPPCAPAQNSSADHRRPFTVPNDSAIHGPPADVPVENLEPLRGFRPPPVPRRRLGNRPRSRRFGRSAVARLPARPRLGAALYARRIPDNIPQRPSVPEFRIPINFLPHPP